MIRRWLARKVRTVTEFRDRQAQRALQEASEESEDYGEMLASLQDDDRVRVKDGDYKRVEDDGDERASE